MPLPRTAFLSFAPPLIEDEDVQAVAETLRSGWINTGPQAKAFEQAFAAAVGARHAVALQSCTAAMHLALHVVGLQPGDEVLVPSYTFASVGAAVLHSGATPVLVDVRADDFNLDVEQAAAAVGPRTRAVLVTHMGGLPADLDAVHALARQHGLVVIEDAAHAFGSTYRGQPIGRLSDFTCFSFNANKPITTGDGGALCTEHDAWAERCRILGLHGITKDAWKRWTAAGSWYYEVIEPGFKYNMTDLAASLGLAQLAKAERMARRRCEIAAAYDAAFGDHPALQIPTHRPGEAHAWHLYMLRLHLNHLTLDRAAFVAELKARNIGTSVHYIPLHIQPWYRETYGYRPEDYPVAYREYLREISLPIHPRMTDEDVQDVVVAVLDIAERARM
jgi:dTDP-4-amino-4,6-dideoxygalactose transaminase